MIDEIKEKCAALIKNGEASRVIGWEKGELPYDRTPAVFDGEKAVGRLLYDAFCGANISKYLIAASKTGGKVIALLKPCDTYSLNQLLTENRVDRSGVYALGVGCSGMVDVEKIRDKGIKGIKDIEEIDGKLSIKTLYGDRTCDKSEVLLEKCLSCKGEKFAVSDDSVALLEGETAPSPSDRFSAVSRIEKMSPKERFEFWRGELSRCIRCNACRNACPACSCMTCVFDNARSGVSSKASPDAFEENMFHIIRAFHVAGRCTDCGECSRVCPQRIPLHLLNRKFIKDINEFYGEYQAGEQPYQRGPLVDYNVSDRDPGQV